MTHLQPLPQHEHQLEMGLESPVFLIGAAGGHTPLPPFAAHLEPAIVLAALTAWSPCSAGLCTVEGIARQHVDEILDAHPRGPYQLLASAPGGAIAYEVAAQLIGRDRAVTFVGLLDADCPGSPELSRLLEGYLVHPLPVPVHVFGGAEPAGGAQLEAGASALCWTRALPRHQLRFVAVQASRDSVLDPAGAAVLGRAVSDAILAARRRPVPAPSYRAQFTIQAGHARRTPLFCVPGAGASVTSFSELAQAFGESWPVHGLQHRGLDGLLVPHSTVQAAAELHVRAIHEIQPRGPLHLLGHSFGGWIALEAAHQLSAGGRSVASLTIIDSEVPDGEAVLGREYTAREVLLELVRVLELAAGKPLAIDPGPEQRLDASTCARLLHQGCVRAGLMPRASRPEALHGVIRSFAAALRTGYQPVRAYHAPVRLVLVSDPHVGAAANQLEHERAVARWRRWAPQLTFWHAPGNHVSALRPPHVSTLADWLRTRLELAA